MNSTKIEPVSSESVSAEPILTEPTQTVLASTETVPTEPVLAESVLEESIPAEPVLTDSVAAESVPTKSVPGEQKNTSEDVVYPNLDDELRDRVNRKNNLILYNIKESDHRFRVNRDQFDRIYIVQILTDLIDFNVDEIVSHYRLGKFDKNISRPIKVMFTDSNLVLSLLKRKKSCKAPFKIGPDLTEFERNQLKDLKAELKILNKDAVIKRIKYVGGIPTIVDIRKSEKPKYWKKSAKKQYNERKSV